MHSNVGLGVRDDVVAARMEAGILPVLRSLAVKYSSNSRPGSVAVVGNQPLGASEARSAVIDRADVVIRINGFRLDEPGAPPAVGTKTDIVVFNRAVRPTPWFFQDYSQRLYLLVEPGRMHWEPERYPHFWPRDLGFVTIPNHDVIVPINAWLGQDALTSGTWATTGTTAIGLATMLFPEVTLDVAGMSMIDDPDQTSWSHAYGDDCIVGPEYLIANEGRLLRRWIDEGRIRFHR